MNVSGNETSHGSFWMRCTGGTSRDRRNLTRMMWIYAAWALAFAGGSQLIKRDLLPAGPLPWIVAALPTALGVFAVLAYGRFLREADELQRAIHLEALALGFAGTWIGVCGYRMFERLGAPAADIADAALFLAVFYALGMVRGAWRYR